MRSTLQNWQAVAAIRPQKDDEIGHRPANPRAGRRKNTDQARLTASWQEKQSKRDAGPSPFDTTPDPPAGDRHHQDIGRSTPGGNSNRAD